MAQEEYFGPDQFLKRDDPTDRVRIPVTKNAVLDCSRYCLNVCGLYGEAQKMALVSSLMSGNVSEPLAADCNDKAKIETLDGESTSLPSVVMSCEGPGKKFVLFGKTVCRGARVDTGAIASNNR